jgi:hypothetical protein
MLIYPSFMKVAPRSASLTKGISNDAGRLVPFRCDEILSLVRSRPALSIDLIAADNPGSFIDDTPTAKLVRQVLGAISEFDKAMTVAKLRGARERKRREAGKCEGRKSHCLVGQGSNSSKFMGDTIWHNSRTHGAMGSAYASKTDYRVQVLRTRVLECRVPDGWAGRADRWLS